MSEAPHTVKSYEEELKNLNANIIKMGSACEDIGLEALNKWREKGFDNKLVTLEVHNTTDSDVLGNNPIYKDDKVVGRATGGEYGFRLDKSIALAMVKPDLANVGEKLKVDILGKMYEATILEESPYDVENKLLRA